MANTAHMDLNHKGDYLLWPKYIPGPVYTSADGQAWAPAKEPVTEIARYACSGEACVGLNQNTLYFARGDQPWESVWSAQAPEQISTVAYGDGLFLAAGANGLLLTSTDGRTWTKRSVSLDRETVTGGRLGRSAAIR